MKRFILKHLLPHPKIKYCSQTIYEGLLGCIKMYESTKFSIWKTRSENLFKILTTIQQPDGGFDIGYEFNFGMIHKKGDSTSPELVGLLALCKYADIFNEKNKVKPYAIKATNWIKEFSVKIDNTKWAIPYSPYTTSEIMVYNGTSFACGALGYYLGIFGDDDSELNEIYRGMINYLEKNLYSDSFLSGRFWYYPVQNRTDLSEEMLNKVDYYHQMQQVEMHSLAQQVNPIPQQIKIIESCSDFILDLSKKHTIIPYTNSALFFGGKIHTWGLCSIASGLIEASKLISDKKELYLDYAKYVIEWLTKYSWNGKYFESVLSKAGKPDNNFDYMVRSDAWVFNTFSTYYKEVKKDPDVYIIIERCFQKMQSVNFSGKESHASSLQKKIISKAITCITKIIK